MKTEMKFIETGHENQIVDFPFYNHYQNIFKSYQDLINIFTTREMEVINLIALGLNSEEISNKLFISKHTVHTHRKNVHKKGKFNNLRDVILFALFEGFRVKNTH